MALGGYSDPITVPACDGSGAASESQSSSRRRFANQELCTHGEKMSVQRCAGKGAGSVWRARMQDLQKRGLAPAPGAGEGAAAAPKLNPPPAAEAGAPKEKPDEAAGAAEVAGVLDWPKENPPEAPAAKAGVDDAFAEADGAPKLNGEADAAAGGPLAGADGAPKLNDGAAGLSAGAGAAGAGAAPNEKEGAAGFSVAGALVEPKEKAAAEAAGFSDAVAAAGDGAPNENDGAAAFGASG